MAITFTLKDRKLRNLLLANITLFLNCSCRFLHPNYLFAFYCSDELNLRNPTPLARLKEFCFIKCSDNSLFEKIVPVISNILKFLAFSLRFTKVFLDHKNIFFSQKVRAILETKYNFCSKYGFQIPRLFFKEYP